MTNKEMFSYCVKNGFNRKSYELLADKNNSTYFQIKKHISFYLSKLASPEEQEIYKESLKQNQQKRKEEQEKLYRQRSIIFYYLIKNKLNQTSTLKIANYFKIDIKEAQRSFDIYYRKYATEEEKKIVRKIKQQKTVKQNKLFRSSILPQYSEYFNIIVTYNFNPLIIEEIINENNLSETDLKEIISIYYQSFANNSEKERYKQAHNIKNKKTDLIIYDYLVYKEFSSESIKHVQETYKLSYEEVIAIINKYYQNKNKNQIQEKIKARVKELINK